MPAITFQIELLEPVLATQPAGGEANSAVTFPFLPGSMIRGALIRAYSGAQGVTLDNPQAMTLFFEGGVRYLNVYPAAGEDVGRTLPTPRSWVLEKEGTQEDAPKESFERSRLMDLSKGEKANAKTASPAPFFTIHDGMVQLVSPTIIVTVHNASDDRNSKSEGTSQVYRYDALAAGQIFAGAIVFDTLSATNQAKLVELLTNAVLFIGGSHTGGYGRVKVLEVKTEPEWKEYAPTMAEPNALFTVTLLSDTLIRNAVGELDQELAHFAGVPPRETFQRLRLVGGFNRTWSMPFLQDWVIEAGSVFVFDASARPTFERDLDAGIGERTTEGFGRFALDLHPKPERFACVSAAVQKPTHRGLSPASEKLAGEMARRQMEREVDRWLIHRVIELTTEGNNSTFHQLPRPAQLSRAQLAARQAWLKTDLGLIEKHFKGLSKLSEREWQFARMGAEDFKGWILNLVRNPGIENPMLDLIPIAGQTANYDTLRVKTTARLIERVLRQAVKRAKQNDEGEAQ